MTKEVKKTSIGMDMCNGPLFGKLLLFAMPLMASGLLQLLFNAADLVVIGRYSPDKYALAAIGATSSLVNFFVNFAIGISVGANVVVARFYGASMEKEVKKAVHTSMLTGLILGVLFGALGFIFSKPILELMDTPANVIGGSILYVRIYFIGMPAAMIYNFGSAVLRAAGDTKRPLWFLSAAGILNVCLNLLFVLGMGMSVEGVAIATTISQCLSAALVVICLMRTKESFGLEIKELKIDMKILGTIMKIGVPAGLQSVIFSLSNMLIQSSVNSFGPDAINGNTASGNIEGFVYVAMNALYHTNLSVSSQNYGAGKIKRMNKTLYYCLGIVAVVGIVLGGLGTLFGRFLINIYRPGDVLAADFGMIRMKIIMLTYCTCGIMEVLCGSLRAYGYGLLPMIVSLIGACGFRIFWIYTAFAHTHTLECLYSSYPLSWVLTITAHAVCLMIVSSKIKKKVNNI